MGYLGLDSTPIKEDNMFQRMFWPSDHAGETDALGKQGFWICWTVAIVSLIVLTLQHQPLLALLQFTFFALDGIGVREHSVTAAVLVAIAYWVNQIYGAFTGHIPGFLWIAAGTLLLANIRGTYIAARWARKGDPDAFSERSTASFKDRFVDQMPLRVWPKGRIPFFVIAGVYMLLLVVGGVVLASRPKSVVSIKEDDQPKSQQLVVRPQ